ncbi:MAG: hypothetical protein AAF203_01355, partial [Pseudomonadota bacterium]
MLQTEVKLNNKALFLNIQGKMPNVRSAIPVLLLLTFLISWVDETHAHHDGLPLRNTVTVPPLELQNGGEIIFETLEGTERDKFFIGQKFDLSLIGPGTNLSFATDSTGTYFGFSFSNGRFEGENDNGSIEDGTFPQKNHEQIGKYPWPRDSHGHFLPGHRLTQSNGPHSGLARRLIKQAKSDGVTLEKSQIYAGHVGIGHDGNVYIGYASASVNGAHKNGPDWKKEYQQDGRALPYQFREALHNGIARTFHGKDLNDVLANAPTEAAEVDDQNAITHFPSDRVIPKYHEMTLSPLDILVDRLGFNGTEDYIARMNAQSAVTLAISMIELEPRYLNPTQIHIIEESVAKKVLGDQATSGRERLFYSSSFRAIVYAQAEKALRKNLRLFIRKMTESDKYAHYFRSLFADYIHEVKKVDQFTVTTLMKSPSMIALFQDEILEMVRKLPDTELISLIYTLSKKENTESNPALILQLLREIIPRLAMSDKIRVAKSLFTEFYSNTFPNFIDQLLEEIA